MTLPNQLVGQAVLSKLQGIDPPAVVGAASFRGELTVEIVPRAIRWVCEFLRQDRELSFNVLIDVTAVDRHPVEPRFEVVYHLLSLPRGERVRLKVRLSGDPPVLDSVTSLWPAANWLEREVFDLFGIQFRGHPHLRRLLMPDDWQGHPLRKDYPVEGTP